MPRIIEIKAKEVDAEHVRSVLKNHNAAFVGKDHQIDTYFKVPNGRLKLREGNIEKALIHYHISNQKGPKKSEVALYKPNQESDVKNLLSKALGVLAVVDKYREIYFVENVKFHIDTVKDLGHFVEIEAIDDEDTMELSKLQEQCEYFMTLFRIDEKKLVANSYSDLIMSLV